MQQNVHKWIYKGGFAEVDLQLTHTSKIVLFTKIDNSLDSTIYAKIFTLDA